MTQRIARFGNYSALCVEDPSQYDPSLCGPAVQISDNPYGVNAPIYQLYTVTSQNQSIAFAKLPFFLSSFIILEILTPDPTSILYYFPRSWQVLATECALRYCSQTYHVTSISGITSRYLLNVSQELGPNLTLQYISPLLTLNSDSINEALSSVVSGTIVAGYNASGVLVDRFFVINDPVKMAANISTALSIWFATSSNDSPANGTVWLSETRVRVIWPWIALPALLVVASAIFLLTVVFETRRRAKEYPFLGIWKNNALVAFFHALDPELRQSMGPNPTVKEMRDTAKMAHVRLVEDQLRGSSLKHEQGQEENDEKAK